MRSGNPALRSDVFSNAPRVALDEEVMTLSGAVQATAILLAILCACALWTWQMTFSGSSPGLYMVVGGIGGFVMAMVTIFKKEWSPVTAPLYAGLEGLALGGISAMTEAQYPGIAIQAISLTFGTLFALLMAYQTRLIRATENFKLGIFAATGGIALIYLASFVLGFFNIHIPLIHESGLVGICFSAFVVVIAALNLVLDFDFIESGAQQRIPKYMNWYGAFGLMVTLVWLYLEILRLLMKLRKK